MRARLYGCVLVLISIASTAVAEEEPTEEEGDYLNLSFAGDGSTPTAMALFDAQERQLAAPRFAATVSDKGDAGYAIPIPLPPARLAPSISLSYSSAGGSHTHVSRGWTLDTGMQVTRITGQAASQAYVDLPGAHRVSVGGLDGLLFESDSEWVYSSTGTVAVEATYEDFGWIVRSGGVTTWLEPHGTIYDDDDYAFEWSHQRAPMMWHVAKMRDEKGNTVEYTWTGNRLDSVLYGGATGDDGAEVGGQEHLVEVRFDYIVRDVPSYQAQGSQTQATEHAAGAGVDVIEDRLDRIVVSTAFETGSLVEQLAVELTYDDIDGDLLLTDVVHRDLVRGGELTIAELDYARLPDPSEYDASDETTPHISWSSSTSKVAGEPSWSDTFATLLDVSGDGLADVLRASGVDDLASSWQLWGTTTSESTWEDASRETEGVSAFDAIDRTVTARCSKHWSKSVSVQRLVDIDGDGLQDIVYSDAPLPEAAYDASTGYFPPELAVFCGEAVEDEEDPLPLPVDQSGADVSWTVHFGTPGGFETTPHTLTSPADFPRMSRLAITSGYYTRETAPELMDVADAQVDLMDVDGDGWQDIVTTTPTSGGEELWVYYHEGWREGGWSPVPVRLTAEGGADADVLEGALFGLATSRQHILGVEHLPVQADWYQFTLQVTETWSMRGFRDVNGDGILDYVTAEPWVAGTWEYWDVYLGTGRRGEGAFHSPPLAWPAPVGYLGRSDEGVPQALTCSLDEGDTLPEEGEHNPRSFPFFDGVGTEGGGFRVDFPAASLQCGFTTPPGPLDADLRPDPATAAAPQRQTVDLIDMDGDGRLDLVDADAPCPECTLTEYRTLWWRNTGAGFSATATEGPGWFGGALNAAISRQVVFLDPASQAAPNETAIHPTDATRNALWSVIDVNRDGMPDRVRVDDPDTYAFDEGGIQYGARPDAGTAGTAARRGLGS